MWFQHPYWPGFVSSPPYANTTTGNLVVLRPYWCSGSARSYALHRPAFWQSSPSFVVMSVGYVTSISVEYPARRAAGIVSA